MPNISVKSLLVQMLLRVLQVRRAACGEDEQLDGGVGVVQQLVQRRRWILVPRRVVEHVGERRVRLPSRHARLSPLQLHHVRRGRRIGLSPRLCRKRPCLRRLLARQGQDVHVAAFPGAIFSPIVTTVLVFGRGLYC